MLCNAFVQIQSIKHLQIMSNMLRLYFMEKYIVIHNNVFHTKNQ